MPSGSAVPSALPRTALLLLPALLAAAACDREAPVSPAAPAELRVASLSPLATRFVRAIGAGGSLVAVDAASARAEGLPGLTVASLEEALDREPDLLLVSEAPGPGHPGLARLLVRGGRVIEFAPHDMEDAIGLVREVGGEPVGRARATRFEATFSRPLAKIGGDSRGQARPRVVAVVHLDPLVIAGGHSLETDLIEIAGGRSVTHPGEEHRLAIGADDWAALAPDLVLVIGKRPASEPDQLAVRNALPPGADVAFFDFDPDFWLDDDPAEPARRLRALIEPLSLAAESSTRTAP